MRTYLYPCFEFYFTETVGSFKSGLFHSVDLCQWAIQNFIDSANYPCTIIMDEMDTTSMAAEDSLDGTYFTSEPMAILQSFDTLLVPIKD